jgi:hypothetical protein
VGDVGRSGAGRRVTTRQRDARGRGADAFQSTSLGL